MSINGDSEYESASLFDAISQAVHQKKDPVSIKELFGRDYALRKFVSLYEQKERTQEMPEPRQIFYMYVRLHREEKKSVSDFLRWFEHDYESTYIWE